MSAPLYIGKGLLSSKVAPLCEGLRPVVIADAHVKELYGVSLAKSLGADLFEIPRGELAKTRETKRSLEDQLFKAGCGKETILLALGGGATMDLVGFVASTYLRGVPLLLLPTTILAMVDAAIGGKTAINTPFGKNLLGTFYLPKAIIADLDTLETLPEKEKIHGFSEVLKLGLIYDRSLWESLENREKNLELLITKAAEGKMAIVAEDPVEKKGYRRILNFGHTIGHALEAASGYLLPHGEAVAIGCVAESFLSMHLGYLSESEFARITPLYQGIKKVSFPREKVLEALLFDKKKRGQEVRVVLIDEIGHSLSFDQEFCRPVEKGDISHALDWVDAWSK